MTILKPQKRSETQIFDYTRVGADFQYRGKGEPAQVTVSLTRLAQAISENRGLAIIGVQMPDDSIPRRAIIQKLERDGQKVSHLVLREVSDSDRIRSKVPIVAVGEIASMKHGRSVLVQRLRAIELRGPVAALDHPVRVNVSRLQPGDSVRARDLELPDGVEIVGSLDAQILFLRPLDQA